MKLTTGRTTGVHFAGLTPPAFSPDGARFAIGDRAGWLVMYERGSTADPEAPFLQGVMVRVPAAGPYSRPEVRSVVWSACGSFLAVHEYRGVCVRDAHDLSERAFVPHVGNGPLALGGGGTWLAALSESSVSILGLPGLERRESHFIWSRGGYEYFRTDTLAVDAGGSLVAVGDSGGSDETAMGMQLRSGDPQVTLIDVEKGTQVGEITNERAHQLAFDPWRGHLLVATFGDMGIFRPDGSLVRRFQPYTGGFGSYIRAFAITERYLVTTSAHVGPKVTKKLDVWDAETLARLGSVPEPQGVAPEWIVASPDGRTLLTPAHGAEPGTVAVRLWELRD